MPLFKIAAHEKLQKLTGKKNVKCSTKYQVLSKETAMIGVVKQKKKATGELVEYTIQMGRSVTSEIVEAKNQTFSSISGVPSYSPFGNPFRVPSNPAPGGLFGGPVNQF